MERRGVKISPGPNVLPPDALPDLVAENARLRLLIGELLLKNQRLREVAPADRSRDAENTADKNEEWMT